MALVLLNINSVINEIILLITLQKDEKLYFTQPGVQSAPLPSTFGHVTSIGIDFKCENGQLCDDIDLNIKGCLHGNKKSYRYVLNLNQEILN